MRLNATQESPISPEISNREATNKQPVSNQGTQKRQRHEGGVRTFERSGRPQPFGVQWRVAGLRKTEFFTTAGDRDRKAASLRREARANTLALVPARDELAEWHAFKEAIGDADWQDVVAAWRSAGGKGSSVTVATMVERYLAEQDKRLALGEIAKVTHKKNCPKAEAFAADFGTVAVDKIEAAEIEDWIDDLGFEAAETFNTYRKVIHSLFEHAKRECPANPVADVKSRSDVGEIEVLSVEEAAKLFKYAEKNCRDLVPRLALEAFAGLRFSSAFRLVKDDLNFDDRGIHLPAHKLKTRRRHYIDGLPDNLWQWGASRR